MDIKQLSEIQCFYTHFLIKIRQLETSQFYRKQSTEYKKSELSEWLIHHKSAKTFGEHVRHEIFHMLELVASEVSVCELEKKIGNLESNCEGIRMELEDKLQLRDVRITPNWQRRISERV
ncbi:hypothetical protein IBT49_16530 [Erwinia sp. S63]|uniref:hypothetical protein n=1 Tax=Erwinia sp. S63 TaxID=2769341 RepID=UPI00190C4926|nr:hypothetical protein [Erwinia sp. S63]MBK0097593.1 hypothetical protein [Erwinia sp. S63]